MSAPSSSFLPSRIGFGVAGAHGTPLLHAGETVRLILQAHRQGVAVFDTAPAYGAGEAERRLGLALASLDRSSVFVSTKAGVTSTGLARRQRDFSPGAVEASLRASLDRMGLDGVDAFILHGPDPSELTAALFARLGALKSAGAFRHLGVAGRGVELNAAIASGHFAIVMAPVHPQIGEAARNRLFAARKGGLAVIGIEAAGEGPAPLHLPRRPADLYTLARTLRSPSAAGGARLAMPQALAAPLQAGLADCVMMSTTRETHLLANVQAIAGHALSAP